MEEGREELARNATNITVNRAKAVKRQAENATKIINDSNKNLNSAKLVTQSPSKSQMLTKGEATSTMS